MHPAVVVGGVVLLAVLLGRGASSSASRPGAGASIPPDVLNEQIVAGVNVDTDFFESQGALRDAVELPEDRHTPWTVEQKAAVEAYREQRKRLFYEQVHQTASRVPVSALTEADMTIAYRFIRGELSRAGCPLTRGQIAKIEAFDESIEDSETAREIINGIAGALTLGIVPALDKGIGGAIARDETGGKASTIEEVYELWRQKVREAGQGFEGSVNDLEIDMRPVLDRMTAAEIDALYDQRAANPTAFEEFYDTGAAWEFGAEPIYVDGVAVFARRHLFDPDNQGAGTWAYPWLSSELACTSSIEERIIRRARLYRALDVWGAALRPRRTPIIVAKPGADGVIDPTAPGAVIYRVPRGLYAYRVGAAELWGCVLPPHPADNAVDLVREQPNVFGREAATRVADPVAAMPSQSTVADPASYAPPAPPASVVPTAPPVSSSPIAPPDLAPVAPLGSIAATATAPTANTSPITLSRLSLYRRT